MIYLFISAIFAASSFAQTTPLLKLDLVSGHTQPQFATEAHCIFDSSLHIIAKILKDRTGDTWQIETNVDNVKSEAEFNQVQTWINEAAEGPFKQGTNPCDIGTITIVTQNFPLLISKDCGKKIENQHPSAQKLITWFREACNIEGKKQ